MYRVKPMYLFCATNKLIWWRGKRKQCSILNSLTKTKFKQLVKQRSISIMQIDYFERCYNKNKKNIKIFKKV